MTDMTSPQEQADSRDGLRSERGFLNAVLDNAGALMVVLNQEGRICRFNRACETLSGYRFAEVEGKFPWDIVLPPEDADSIREQAFEALVNNPQALTGHYSNYWQSKDGSRHLIDWYNTLLLDDDGHMNYMVSIGVDVTDKSEMEAALKRNQETFRRAEAMAHIGSWDWDIVSGELHWSDEIYRIFGLTPQAFGATYDAFLAAIHPDDREQVIAAVNASVADSRIPYEVQHRVVRPDGQRRYVRERGEVYRDESGQALRMIGTVLDITEQKLTEQALQQHQEHLEELVTERAASLVESEEQLRRAQALAHLGHWSVNVQTDVLQWSDEIYRIFGRAPQSFQPSQTAFFACVHPHDKDTVLRAQEQAFASGTVMRVDHRIVLPDGTVRWVHEEAVTELDENGQPLRMTGTVQDISERKQAEVALVQAREEAERQGRRNQIILSATMDAFILADPRGRIVDINPAASQMLGYAREEFLTLSIADIEAMMDPATIQARIKRITEQGYDRFETRQRRKDGGVIDVEVSSAMAEIGGETFVFGFERDITARKQAEQELRDTQAMAERLGLRNEIILETALDGFMMVDMQGKILDVNPAYQDILGYRYEEFTRLRIADIEAVESENEVAGHIKRIIEQGYDRFESRQRHKDGRAVDVEVSATLTQLGEDRFFFCFVRDITERRQAERELLQAKELAEKANNAKSEFLSRMSHELRTPMNAILGFAQVLEMESLSAQQKSFVGEISHAGKHLLDLINELLDLTRIESGSMAMQIQPVAVMPVVRQALAIVQGHIAQRGLQLQLECADEYQVLADEMRLKQVLVNLLDNAAKYNRTGGELRVQCQLRDNQCVRISVSDTGKGMTPTMLEKLFTPFERLGAESTGIDGTGIGLVLSKQLVVMMGGEIGVASRQDEGTTFWLEFPLADAAAPGHAENAAGPPAAVSTVVYVEDNPINLRLVQALFRHCADLKLISATTGEQGLELIEKLLPDLVLMDIQLPGMSGFEVLQQMRNQAATRHIPVIALTADALPMEVERGLQAGFRKYLTKPLDTEELIATVRELLSSE